jgi:hypothetical protein
VGDLGEDPELRDLLLQLSPPAHDKLRIVLIHDQADPRCDRLAPDVNHDETGDDWADIIDFLTMWPEARRRVARSGV